MSGPGVVGAADPVTLPAGLEDGALITVVDASEPLDSSPIAVAVVPESVMVTLIGDAATDRGAALLLVTRQDENTAIVDLGDGYLLTVDRPSASVLLNNRATGLQTIIWGDGASVSLDGSGEGARFWGSLTFALDNGAVITASTAQAADNPMIYMLDVLTVTRESAAVIISNVAPDIETLLEVAQSNDGWHVEQSTADGMVLEVAPAGDGWVREGTMVVADTEWVAATAPRAEQAFAHDALSGREFGRYSSWTNVGLSRLGGPAAGIEASRDDRAAALRRVYLDSLRPLPSA